MVSIYGVLLFDSLHGVSDCYRVYLLTSSVFFSGQKSAGRGVTVGPIHLHFELKHIARLIVEITLSK